MTIESVPIPEKYDGLLSSRLERYGGTISKTESQQELKEKEARLFADDKAKEFTAKHQAWIHETADLVGDTAQSTDLEPLFSQ